MSERDTKKEKTAHYVDGVIVHPVDGWEISGTLPNVMVKGGVMEPGADVHAKILVCFASDGEAFPLLFGLADFVRLAREMADKANTMLDHFKRGRVQ